MFVLGVEANTISHFSSSVRIWSSSGRKEGRAHTYIKKKKKKSHFQWNENGRKCAKIGRKENEVSSYLDVIHTLPD